MGWLSQRTSADLWAEIINGSSANIEVVNTALIKDAEKCVVQNTGESTFWLKDGSIIKTTATGASAVE